jgi:hypothetical protein
MKKEKTERGFGIIKFFDRYGEECSLQKSSIGTEDCIWVGISEAVPRIMAKDTSEGGNGWRDYKIPNTVFINSRMHLTRKMVLNLLPNFIKFIITGNI